MIIYYRRNSFANLDHDVPPTPAITDPAVGDTAALGTAMIDVLGIPLKKYFTAAYVHVLRFHVVGYICTFSAVSALVLAIAFSFFNLFL